MIMEKQTFAIIAPEFTQLHVHNGVIMTWKFMALLHQWKVLGDKAPYCLGDDGERLSHRPRKVVDLNPA